MQQCHSFFQKVSCDRLCLQDGLEAPPEELPAEERGLDDDEDLPIEDLLDTEEDEDLSLAALLRKRMQEEVGLAMQQQN